MKSGAASAFVLLLTAFAAGAAFAATVIAAQIADAGVYALLLVPSEDSPASTTASSQAVAGVKLVEAKTRIPGVLGVNFGFRFQLLGMPQGEEVQIKTVLLLPVGGMRDPDASVTIDRYETVRLVQIGAEVHLGYGFKLPWEIVPGTWTWQIWHEERQLAEQSFEVVAE